MLIDSTAFVDLIRNYPPAVVAFEKQLYGQSISVASKLELIVGLKTKKEIASLEKFFTNLSIKVLPIDKDISDTAEVILTKYYHSHGIGILDSIIAATALVYNKELVTRNTKHFSFIPNLKLLKPY